MVQISLGCILDHYQALNSRLYVRILKLRHLHVHSYPSLLPSCHRSTDGTTTTMLPPMSPHMNRRSGPTFHIVIDTRHSGPRNCMFLRSIPLPHGTVGYSLSGDHPWSFWVVTLSWETTLFFVYVTFWRRVLGRWDVTTEWCAVRHCCCYVCTQTSRPSSSILTLSDAARTVLELVPTALQSKHTAGQVEQPRVGVSRSWSLVSLRSKGRPPRSCQRKLQARAHRCADGLLSFESVKRAISVLASAVHTAGSA
ncbi:hypothetical protein BJ546DRAFT_553189 [Cryomyces antarcticus]